MSLTLLSFFVILIVLVFVHELGHFLTAKWFGVKVEEFGFGYPPRLVGVRWRGTIYSINALPLGGFVKMLGEENPSAPGSLASKSRQVRALVLCAGAIMNAILPVVLFSASFMVPRQIAVGQVVVQEVAAGSPAALGGIQPGDVLVSINGNEIQNVGDLRYQLQLNLGKPVDMALKRADSLLVVRAVPRWRPPPGEGATGITVRLENATTSSISYPVWRAVPMGIRTLGQTFVLVKNTVVGWFIGGGAPQVTGPVGIAEITGQVARAGVSPLLEFTGLLSINLAILNLFPIPGLDGGRLVFVVIEAIRRGRRISPQREGLIHMIGFVALLALVFLVTYFDILRIVRGESLIR